MKPINKTLVELLNEKWELMETFSDSLKIYSRGNERIFYDAKNKQILWGYTSNINHGQSKN
jgi:hypothetical protein